MNKVNTHGITANRVKEASGATKNAKNIIQLSYDRLSGDVYAEEFAIAPKWIDYPDRSIIFLTNTRNTLSMQEIYDLIKISLERAEKEDNDLGYSFNKDFTSILEIA